VNKNLGIILAVVAAILLYLFMGRKTLPASTAPSNQPGVAAGGINFVSTDVVTGLPVFDATANSAFIRGLAADVGGMYTCGNGTTPALNASDGRIYCVIPAESGIFSSASPVVAPAAYTGAPQGPTQSGGYLGGPAVPQGPTQSGGYLGGPTVPPSAIAPDLSVSSATDPTGLQSDSMAFFS
jgi:hypothetical protein